jgi:hypothetical protein
MLIAQYDCASRIEPPGQIWAEELRTLASKIELG